MDTFLRKRKRGREGVERERAYFKKFKSIKARGSAWLTRESTLQASKTSLSVSNDITSTPTIGEHDFKVITFRMKGWLSPCRVTRLATYRRFKKCHSKWVFSCSKKSKDEKIKNWTWMTGSCLGSGKWPLRPAHSISKLKMRNGAIFEYSPSGGWLISPVYLRIY